MSRPGRMPTVAAAFSILSATTSKRAGRRAVATAPGCGGRSASAASPGSRASSGSGPPAGAVRTRPRIGRHRPNRPRPPPPTPRKAARLLMSEPDKLSADDRRFVTALLELSPPIARAVELAKAFSTMIKEGLADRLDDWISAAEKDGFKGFAGSLRQDRDAVHAALTMPWSTGSVEGQINRLKVIKRSMYGRAGFDLLRRRVLAAP